MKVLVLAAALALAGCAGGGFAGFERPVAGGGAGLPETVARASQAVVTPPGRRMLGLAVRSYERDAAGEIVEVAGADCAIEAGAYQARLVTPGRLVLPDLGPDAPAITATCLRGGRTGRQAVEPEFAWADGASALQRVLWGGGAWPGGPRTGPLRYPDLMVGLEAR